MYSAIVFLPLLGFLIAGIAGLSSYRFAKTVEHHEAGGHDDHAAGTHSDHTHDDHGHDDHAVEPSPHSPGVIRFAEFVTTGFLVISCVLSWIAFFKVGPGGLETQRVHVGHWFSAGALQVDWALRIDTLTVVMLVVVTTVSALVHLYSVGYMAEDPSRPRFFAYLSLFTFAMLMLVTSDNLVQMFFGWEGVGLASYLLIGFWYERPAANAAAMKAFIVNRVGDFGFALGIFLVFALTQSVGFEQIFAAAPGLKDKTTLFLGHDWPAMTVACLLLFMGAMGKSAQFLLHTWLPDAMEGPTPVSALIHAATMVTAGVFMVARLSPLFEQSTTALTVVMVVGGTTAFFAASVALVQNDIKRVIAYSTCSQLGYMFVALGAGAYSAGIFHLFTHAFFKALLFLCAGAVITAMHHEQDMRKMGGLMRKIPFTAAMMTIGNLALTGFPFTAGFYSKDAIIEASYVATSPANAYACILLIIAAGMTSFYSWRLFFMTFWGETRADKHTYDHAKESPLSMTIPLALLAIGALFAGYAFVQYFIGHQADAFWRGALFFGPDNHVMHNMHDEAMVPAWVKWSPTVTMVIGFVVAWLFYVAKPYLPEELARSQPLAYRFLLNKWYIDELYDLVFVRGGKWLGYFLWKRGDGTVIDGIGPDGVSSRVLDVTGWTVKLQSGYVYHYAFAMLLGVAALFTYFMFGGLR